MKKYFLIFIVSFLLFWGMAVLRGGYVTILGITGFKLSALVGFLVMSAWTLFSLLKWKQLKPGYILLAVWIGISILELPHRISSFESTLVSLPTYLSWCLGILTGYLSALVFKKAKKRLLFIVFTSTYLILSFGFVFYGHDLFMNKFEFGTFTGKVSEEVVKSPVEFQDQDGNIIKLMDFQGQYLILDFWNSGCGICFQKFPVVQEAYDKYKDAHNIALYSIHCRRENKGETLSTGNGRLLEKGYTFPNLSMSLDNPILKEIGVEVFPTVIIFSPEGQLIFRGRVESATAYIDELTN